LIILLHGTWGGASPWAIPEQSLLTRSLSKRLTTDLDFRRFSWSGANRPSARIEAADRLANELRSELSAHDRPIFVLAHSHGGNIAVRAFEALSEMDRQNVQSVLLGTPFLSSGRRFEVKDVYDVMPTSIQQHLIPICWAGFGGGAFVILAILHQHLTFHGVP